MNPPESLDPDEPTAEQAVVIERELNRVFGGRSAGGMLPMFLPLTDYDEFIALLKGLPENATDTQLRAGLERVRTDRRSRSREVE